MSYQCKNCEREKDQNNNYVNATYAANANGTRGSRASSARSGVDQRLPRNTSGGLNNEATAGGGTPQGTGSGSGATQVTAKVMWGSVGAIKELREKEQAERNQVTRAGRRQ
ncbi:uncharacterized protein LOC131677699 [Topomyia yanbarensis]|uniref:uncharacterized protein LOC131677699 n=1 Tax=Topomyia yanbarensis TaxID=2498891 RepID=UPI00273BB789|nr:uncharacterized protein LOC131677699 [Topomyia yanbarensis]